MGRGKNRKGGKRGRSDDWLSDPREAFTLKNEAFEVFYKNAAIVPPEEWSAFMECLRTGLPMSFRINTHLDHSEKVYQFLLKRLSAYFDPVPISFFPHKWAIQCDVSRGDLKRNEEYKGIKKILSAFSDCGYLTRQETVSMIPPILLQVEKGHTVLDLCAAPGSKSSQILEYLLSDRDSGVLVANDLNASRLDVLHHQTNRAPLAHPHLIITNYDATRFPILASEDKFDRVLCDVVCSGDGTLRKSLDMWPRWNCVQGADLHNVQCRMLLRGMTNCKQGGIVVYSTCSLNPVEDEAVVSECLRKAGTAFRLMEVDHLLPGFKTTPGLPSWTLTTKDLSRTLSSFEEATEYMKSMDHKAFQYKASMFATESDLKEQNIHFAKRILPHHQDTGGFFIAAFCCVHELSEKPTEMDEEGSIHPLSFEYASTVKECLSLPDDFDTTRLMHRPESSRDPKIYYASPAAMSLAPKLGKRVIHVGAKVFESFIKYSDTKLRFSADGVGCLPYILPQSFFVECNSSILKHFRDDQSMTHEDFEKETGRKLSELPTPSFLISTEFPLIGKVFTVAEKNAKIGRITAKVFDWQMTLCGLSE